MRKWWVVAVGAPWLYLLAVGRAHRGFGDQWRVAAALTPERFAAAVAEAGGPDAVRAGVALDLVFIGGFAAGTATVLRRAGRGWWVPLAAAATDLAENGFLAAWADGTPSRAGTAGLTALAVVKTGLYLASIALAVAALRRPRR